MTEPGRTRLTSWKEIASYLRREVRTVIRWEKERGLPVHRVPGGQGRSVFAFTDELDRWAAGELSAPSTSAPGGAASTRSGIVAALGIGAVLVMAGVAGGLAGGWPHREIARVQVVDGALEARDGGGEVIWSHALGGRTDPLQRRVAHLVDLDGDGHRDVVATAVVRPPEQPAWGSALYAFTERGDPLWRHVVEQPLSFGAGDYAAPWMPDDVMTFRSDGRPFVAWALHHFTWWPSMLAVVDAQGTRVGTFVNAGWIRSSEPSVDGSHIIAAGFTNSRNGAAFAVLDARRPDGSSPEEPGSFYECRNCPAGRPLRYFVLDWSDVASGLPPDDRDALASVHPGSGTIELRAKQRSNVELIVELSPSFELRKRSVSDSFWEWHRVLEQNGTLTHGRETCPFRNGPIVREWTPSGGWKTHEP